MQMDPGSKVILQIGSNDLTYSSPESVVKRLMAFVYYLVDSRHMSKVVICQLLHRRRLRSASIHGSIENYNKAVDWVNFLVQQLSYISPMVNYREHNRAVRNERCIDDDGVHLNSQGMVHYRRSIIGVLNSEEKHGRSVTSGPGHDVKMHHNESWARRETAPQ